jgi:hypothetical protein
MLGDLMEPTAMDLKASGYFVSTVSVILLGIVAWPKPNEPDWIALAVALGMLTSVCGMGLRYLSHRKDRRDVERAKREARAAKASAD